MNKAKYGYGWVLKFVLAAILLGVGIYMVFADEVNEAIRQLEERLKEFDNKKLR